jgi:hypothetical protein
MRVRVSVPLADCKRLRDKVLDGAEKIEDDEMGLEEWEVVRSFLAFSSTALCSTYSATWRLC